MTSPGWMNVIFFAYFYLRWVAIRPSRDVTRMRFERSLEMIENFRTTGKESLLDIAIDLGRCEDESIKRSDVNFSHRTNSSRWFLATTCPFRWDIMNSSNLSNWSNMIRPGLRVSQALDQGWWHFFCPRAI
jgi:hypothetical protein